MSHTIHCIPLGVTRCYLLLGADGRAVLVDAGTPHFDGGFARALARLDVAPSQIELVVLTHGHADHLGCARTIRELTGAPIAMHASEKDRLELARIAWPTGITPWGHVLAGLLRVAFVAARFPSAPVDRVVHDEGLSLRPYGLPGRVLHTPGHSPGSLSVVLDTGEAFVGDLAMNGLPLRFGPGLPVFSEDPSRLRDSWQLLFDAGARQLFPAHGKPVAAERMREALAAWHG
jgi:hydroxyacylglutathione hydrolase